LTLDRVILHTVMRTDGQLRPTLLGRLGGVDLKIVRPNHTSRNQAYALPVAVALISGDSAISVM